MSLLLVRWLVELRDGGRPVGLYLHAFEGDARTDAGTEWQANVTRALRFASKAAADEHIRAEVELDAVAAPFAAEDLVATASPAAGHPVLERAA